MKDLAALFRFSLAGLRLLVAATVLLGVVYPLAVTGIAQVALPWRADGSLVTAEGDHARSTADAVGSALIGQPVDDDGLFQPRPSAAGEGYDPLSSGGSNLGPESPDLAEAIEARRAEVAARERVAVARVPPDAVTASASGLDPHISPAYAYLQVDRVARVSGLTPEAVRSLVEQHISGRTLGFLGESRVDVLALNTSVLGARESGGR